jgi:hypothetical protein
MDITAFIYRHNLGNFQSIWNISMPFLQMSTLYCDLYTLVDCTRQTVVMQYYQISCLHRENSTVEAFYSSDN